MPPATLSKLSKIADVHSEFYNELKSTLNLTKVPGPLIVCPKSGLNDDLNGIEKKVFFTKDDRRVEVVQSLAKWKRQELGRLQANEGDGICVDMMAIRQDEEFDHLHSLTVDQWDWELSLGFEESRRSEETLKAIAEKIYACVRKTWMAMASSRHNPTENDLPEEVTFVTTRELEEKYPDETPKERERIVTKKHKAVFLIGIGDIHDGRAADYDDWTLNGDLICWHEGLQEAVELSSMGIRVNATALERQLKVRDETHKRELPFHKKILNNELPFTIGGGIGKSRLSMLVLNTYHIGEVQSSFWPEKIREECEQRGIFLL
uniref:Aminoacyl-transfer RNA synthetases class-II family profile domain-containing protein n=1 Tax=Percolomonas cosmopolitus TaxID=63605 RepID=A0A7S1KQI3_9EUKA|mmetsp:Transcript_4896/g.18385  ORF Transcript_4896/g.18385 Transcript_4896/m.18385 type:complete len:320 (+) Transcript_4896:94-1053(+)